MSDATKLARFTGYYSMDAAPGAFLSIDTTETPLIIDPITPPEFVLSITVNVSLDGKSCTSYPFAGSAQFDGMVLVIPDADLVIDLVRNYKDGQLAQFGGRIGTKAVSGYTYYNPVPLSAFVGDYFLPTGQPVLSISEGQGILFDYSVFSGGGQLAPVNSYTYTPAMFVLGFNDFVVMLGTAGAAGLACGIQSGGKATMGFSIV